MMNLFKLSEQLKDFSKDQLVQEMKAPSGAVPQYLILSELQRRTRMEREAASATGPEPTTVAQDAVAAAGIPQAGLAGMAQAMAPQTDMAENTGIAAMAPPVERMQVGGEVEGPATATYQDWLQMSRSEREDAGLPTSVIGGQLHFNRFGVGLGRNDPETGARIADVEPRVTSMDEFTGLPDYMTDQYAEPPEDIRNPMRVLFGDEAIDAIPSRSRPDPEPEPLPQDTGVRLADQGVEDLLPPAREPEAAPADAPGGGSDDYDRMYEQDRWLSLARFGLGLMSSREPTLGGAIGEAGAGALDYMTAAREGMLDRRMQEREMDLQEQALALRAASGGRDTGATMNQLVQRLQDQQEFVASQLLQAATPQQEMALTAQLASINQQLSSLLGLPAAVDTAPRVDARPGFFERLFN